MAGYSIELDRGDATRTIESPHTVSFVTRHTASGTFTIVTDYSLDLEDWVRSDLSLYYDDQLLFRGILEGWDPDERAGTTTLTGRDVTRPLTKAEQYVRYKSTPVWQAIDDYWTNYVDGFDATVHEPDTTLVVEDELIQSASTTADFDAITTIGSTDPLAVRNDRLETLQSCFTIEGEDRTRGNVSTNPSATGETSGGASLWFQDTDDYAEWDIDLEYTIPAEYVGVQVRDDDGNDDSSNAFSWYLNGNLIDSDDVIGANLTLGWTNVGDGAISAGNGYTGGDLTPGTHTLRVEIDDGGGTNDQYEVDVVAVYDKRYAYNFDNDNGGGGGYLDGPELYPDAVSTTLAREGQPQSYNVAGARVDSAWVDADVSNGQAIGVSNDQGDTFETRTNTDAFSVEFSTFGTTLEARLTLSRYGTRDTATPQTGFKGQAVDVWNLYHDANILTVIDNQEFSGSHLDNLQDLHALADYRFTVTYTDTDPVPVESYARGSVTKASTWRTLNRNPKRDISGYANRVVVRGARKPDSEQSFEGERYEAVAESSSEIERIGGEETALIDDRRLQSNDDVRAHASAELSKRVSEDERTGTLDIVPAAIPPGYRYPIDEWGSDLDLEEVHFSEGYQKASGRLQFELKQDVISEIIQQKQDLKRTKDAM